MVAMVLSIALIFALLGGASLAFTPMAPRPHNGVSCTKLLESKNNSGGGGFFQRASDFFQELDNFMDDASARRLGNGAAFYGKRKSSFYGENDKQRKQNANMPDPTEDYQVEAGGYFQWMQDEEGQMRPVTRMKKKIVERNPNFWDKVYEKQEK